MDKRKIRMEILDLNETHLQTYLHCLEDWSDEMREAGNHKHVWFNRMKDRGLRVRIAVEDGKACGMIQYVPSEHSFIEGDDLYFIHCIWVHGHKQGVGNRQKRGMGKALLEATERDVESMGRKGIAAWGLALPFWMKASWFKKQGYRKADKDGMAVLLWKPFADGAAPPRWIRLKKKPQPLTDRVAVTSFVNRWCTAQNGVHERARRAAAEFGDRAVFQEIRTSDRNVFLEWGISDALFIDGKQVRTGPPPSFEKIRKKIAGRVKKRKTQPGS